MEKKEGQEAVKFTVLSRQVWPKESLDATRKINKQEFLISWIAALTYLFD